MAEYALANAPYPGTNTPYKRGVLLPLVLTSNATTVAVASSRSGAGFTVTTGADGAVTGTLPKAARGVAFAQALGATADTIVCTFTALDPVAGTFAIQTHVDNVQAILPSGAELWITFFLEGG